MPLQSGNFADLLKPGLKTIFDIGMSQPRPIMEMLFSVENSTRFQESYQGMGATGLVPPFEGSSSFNNTVETDAVNIFINGFTDSGTNRMGASTNGGDDVALLSAAHPHSPANSNNTQANEGTLALTIDNLDTTRQAMRSFTDDKSQLLGVNPDMLLVPPELERTATQLVNQRAIYEPGSAQYDVNMFSGRFQLVVWDRLTDSNAWFLIDSALMKQHLIWQWRIPPEFSQAEDFDGLTAKFRGYMRYGVGWTDWRWIYGQNPS